MRNDNTGNSTQSVGKLRLNRIMVYVFNSQSKKYRRNSMYPFEINGCNNRFLKSKYTVTSDIRNVLNVKT